MLNLRVLPALFLLVLSVGISAAHAKSYKGELSFTEAEKNSHLMNMSKLVSSAVNCLRSDLSRHNYFIDKYGVSAFYGDQSSFAKKTVRTRDGREMQVDTTVDEKRYKLRDIGLGRSLVKDLIPDGPCNLRDCPLMMQPTSCVGITRKCLAKGFRDSGQAEVWNRLDAYVMGNGETGDSLINGLQMLGWKVHYWSPDPRMHEQWDLDEKERFPGNPRGQWGHHAYSYLTVTRKLRYYLNTVDDYTSMVGFGSRTPIAIKNAPLFVGIAHLGYHVFPGTFGTVIEGHSQRQVTDPYTVESSPFAPLTPNGGPRGGAFRTGIVAFPPTGKPQSGPTLPAGLELPRI